jgi:RNA polymerase sigma factor (sigma-70 family)
MILQLVVNNNGDEDEAKDIYQEAIIVLYNKVKRGDFELSSKLKTYIYSICRRLWLKRLKQLNRYGGDIKDFQEYLPVEDEVEKHEERDMQLNKMGDALNFWANPAKLLWKIFICTTDRCRIYANGLDIQTLITRKRRNTNVCKG